MIYVMSFLKSAMHKMGPNCEAHGTGHLEKRTFKSTEGWWGTPVIQGFE